MRLTKLSKGNKLFKEMFLDNQLITNQQEELMKSLHKALLFCVAVLIFVSTPLMAREKAGVLLQPSAGVSQELSDDMTEVFINEIGSRRDFFFVTKEELRARFEEERKGSPNACAKDIACFREVGRLLSLDLMVMGTISMQEQAYKIEIIHVSMTDRPDRSWTYEAKGGKSILVACVQSAVAGILLRQDTFVAVKQDRRALDAVVAPLPSMEQLKIVEQSPTLPEKGASVQRIFAYSTAGVAVMATGLGGYFLWKTKDIESFLNDNCSNGNSNGIEKCSYTELTMREKVSQGKNSILLANISFGVAGAAAVVSALLFVLEPDDEPSTTLLPLVNLDGAGFSAAVRF